MADYLHYFWKITSFRDILGGEHFSRKWGWVFPRMVLRLFLTSVWQDVGRDRMEFIWFGEQITIGYMDHIGRKIRQHFLVKNGNQGKLWSTAWKLRSTDFDLCTNMRKKCISKKKLYTHKKISQLWHCIYTNWVQMVLQNTIKFRIMHYVKILVSKHL